MTTTWWKSNNPHRYGTTGSTVLGWSESSKRGKGDHRYDKFPVSGHTTNFQSRGAVFQLPNAPICEPWFCVSIDLYSIFNPFNVFIDYNCCAVMDAFGGDRSLCLDI